MKTFHINNDPRMWVRHSTVPANELVALNTALDRGMEGWPSEYVLHIWCPYCTQMELGTAQPLVAIPYSTRYPKGVRLTLDDVFSSQHVVIACNEALYCARCENSWVVRTSFSAMVFNRTSYFMAVGGYMSTQRGKHWIQLANPTHTHDPELSSGFHRSGMNF